MNLMESIRSAVDSILAHKMRTLLTMIGIIIGVASTITIIALGNGFKATIEKQLSVFNTNAIQVTTDWSKYIEPKDMIDIDDVDAVGEHTGIKYVSGYKMGYAEVTLKDGKTKEFIDILGSNTSFSYMQKNFFQLKEGRVFSEKENSVNSPICIIDENLAKNIFGKTDVINEKIELKVGDRTEKYRIIGITKSENYIFSKSLIIMPINTLLNMYRGEDPYIDMIYVEPYDVNKLKEIGKEVSRLIAVNHKLKEDKYMATSNREQTKKIENVINIFTIFIAFVASIALLVGGIGIMNIMLVIVTERTREIGIKKSLGATEKNIQLQFLIESILICLIAGIIGIILGYIGAILFSHIISSPIKKLSGMTFEKSYISLPTAILFASISILVGVIFGVYPARKASKLNPIEALRCE